jgi:ABC-type transporter Mla MlaB component
MSECRFAATAEGLALSGELVFSNATAAYGEGLRLLHARPESRIDVAAVTAIDSAGLAVLLAWRAAIGVVGTGPSIRGLPDKAQALARVGGVLDLLTNG